MKKLLKPHRLNFRVGETLYGKITAYATLHEMSITEAIIELIELGLENLIK